MTLLISTCRLPHAAMAIQPDGAITADNAWRLRDRVTAVLAATKPETVVVDLGAVPAMDEAGSVQVAPVSAVVAWAGVVTLAFSTLGTRTRSHEHAGSHGSASGK